MLVFDVDGTLCDTCDVDDECFGQACCEALGLDLPRLDWSSAPHVSDEGILRWLWAQHLGRPPSALEVDTVKARFMALLEDRLARSPERFAAVQGAPEALGKLRERGWTSGVATGGWSVSARLKLAAAGMATERLLATSDDSPSRVEIFRMAAERLARGGVGLGSVVLVGDGVWDVRVARELRWSFVGIASGAKAVRLREAGAPVVLESFGDLDLFEGALRTAERLPPPSSDEPLR